MNPCKGHEPLPLYINQIPSCSLYASSVDSEAPSSLWSDVCSQASDDTAPASSTSADSVWSDAHSQSSEDSSNGVGDESENESYCYTKNHHPCERIHEGVEKSSKSVVTCTPNKFQYDGHTSHNPRRTSLGPVTRTGRPPSLLSQEERKTRFVDNLVDSSAQIVETIWTISSTPCTMEMGPRGVLPLRTFIQETLRRSRTSYYTLQVALYYLILIKPHIPDRDLTMEQPDHAFADRALLCGRRMFLAALILASKYLQDRNYSARAWSKISGLNTVEINQNEMSFLKAVNFRLHITAEVFQRWNDIVLRYTPNEGPDPSAPAKRATPEQAEQWKSIVFGLEPGLCNVAGIDVPEIRPSVLVRPSCTEPYLETTYTFGSNSNENTPSTKYSNTPNVLEPCPSTNFTSCRRAPALGLLPTPRMTPQSNGFCTPAASVTPFGSARSSMCQAMAQVSSAHNTSTQERWQHSLSPLGCTFQRRSSLANSVSSASSPESMVSDISAGSSRSSSISSASSLMSAPATYKLDVQARCRYAKRCNEERSLRTTSVMTPVLESVLDLTPTASPGSYTGPVGRDFCGLSLDTPPYRFQSTSATTDYFSKDSAHYAARALQDLHNHPRLGGSRHGLKRSRTDSIGHSSQSLQDNVREMLMASAPSTLSSSSRSSGWSEHLVRERAATRTQSISDLRSYSQQPPPQRQQQQQFQAQQKQIPMPSPDGRKRMCYEPVAAGGCNEAEMKKVLASSGGEGPGPGMWMGILN